MSMCTCIRYFYILAMCFVLSDIYSATEHVIKYHCSKSSTHLADRIDLLLPDTFVMGKWRCTCDVATLESEIRALFDFVEGQAVSRSNCKRQFERLAKQQRFISADITFTSHEDTTWDISLHGVAGRVLESVIVSGALIGKDKYRQLYVVKPGELFNDELHAIGIKKIKNALHKEGFLSAQIEDTITYNDVYYTAHVSLRIAQGQRYKINNASVKCDNASGLLDHDAQKALKSIKALLRTDLLNSLYDNGLLQDVLSRARKILVDYGFMAPTLDVQELVDEAAASIKIHINLDYGVKHLLVMYGNRFFSRTELLDHLFNFGSSLTLIPPALLAEELIALYKQRGFWGVSIT